MLPSLHGNAQDARLRAIIAQFTPICGVVERGVQVVCIAFGDIRVDLDHLT